MARIPGAFLMVSLQKFNQPDGNPLMVVVAWLFVSGTAIAVLFQLALVLGAPFGHLSMGGRYPGKLPLRMRVAVLLQSGVLIFLAAVVLSKAGVAWQEFYELSETAIWFVVGIYTLSLIMNIATPSKWERIIWAPVALLLFVCSILVALQ